jgi:trk system potassium uptake protein TrkA
MNFIIVGCGRVGAELAVRMSNSGHEIVIVDQNKSAFERLPADYRGRTVHGEALSEKVLERAGVKEAHGLAAVTNSDTLNTVVAHAARVIFNVPVIVCRNYDPRMRYMMETFGLQTVSSTAWGAQRVEELLTNATSRAVYSAGNGEVEIYEVVIPEMWSDRTWNELCVGNKGTLPVALTRAGRAILPDLETKLKSGDLLNVSATFEGIQSLRTRLDKGAEA